MFGNVSKPQPNPSTPTKPLQSNVLLPPTKSASCASGSFLVLFLVCSFPFFSFLFLPCLFLPFPSLYFYLIFLFYHLHFPLHSYLWSFFNSLHFYYTYVFSTPPLSPQISVSNPSYPRPTPVLLPAL